MEGVVGAGRCACATRRPRQASADLGLEARAGEKAKKTECLEEEVDLAQLDNVLDWLTLFAPADPDAEPPEPIAGGDDAGQPSSSSSAPPPSPYPGQQYMQHAFHQECMVGEQKPETKRQKRARRAQLRDSGFRLFTTDVIQARSLRCKFEIERWIYESLQFRSGIVVLRVICHEVSFIRPTCLSSCMHTMERKSMKCASFALAFSAFVCMSLPPASSLCQ